jgi:hypothetical protein
MHDIIIILYIYINYIYHIYIYILYFRKYLFTLMIRNIILMISYFRKYYCWQTKVWKVVLPLLASGARQLARSSSRDP